MIHIITITLPKPIAYTTPRVNSNVNYGLGVVMMYPCKFINGNKCTTLQGVLIMGEAVHVWGLGVYGKSLCFPLNFAVNLKLL